MEQIKLETVKRRFDWVTACGLLFFALIVVAELVVAVGVPLLVRRQGVMAAKVAKVGALELFDARRRSLDAKSRSLGDDMARNEAALAVGTLNFLADYLRRNADAMTTAQFNRIHQMLLEFSVVDAALNKNVPHAERLDLDTSGVIARLAAPVPPPQQP